MEFKSTFDLMIGNACIQQIDVKADVSRDGADWYVSAVYADAIEVAGKCPEGEAYVEIPSSHPLHKVVLMHFLNERRADIDARWSRRLGGYPSFIHANSAGRTYP
jgi:hypothetical protein